MFGVLLAFIVSVHPAASRGLVDTLQCDFGDVEAHGLMEAAVQHRYILIGDWHGSEEIPAFVTALTCAMLERGEHVLLALEMPMDMNETFRRFLSASSKEESTRILFKHSFWDLRGGRTSMAMFEMLMQVHAWRCNGRDVDIRAVDIDYRTVEPDKPLPDRNQHMGESTAELGADGKYDRIILLAGIGHVRNRPDDPRIPNYLPKGSFLNIDIDAMGGTRWACGGPRDNIECRLYDLKQKTIPNPLLNQFIRLKPGAGVEFGARILLPRFTASEPAQIHYDPNYEGDEESSSDR